jgi:Tol biopolymer transport system component
MLYSGNSVRVTIPASALGTINGLRVAAVIGPVAGPTDCAPNNAPLLISGGTPGGGTASVTLSVTPERLVQSGPVILRWTPQNVSSCNVTGGAAGTTFGTPANNQVSANVSVGTSPRNDVFRVNCSGSNGSASNTAVLAVGVPPPPPPRPVTNLSNGIGGVPANGASTRLALSDGGRYAVFESSASNLVAGDTNGRSDVFRRDVVNGTVQRVSVDDGGAQSSLVSGEASVSRNGRFIAYTRGTGFAATGATSKAILQGEVCIRDSQGNVVVCITKGPGGAPPNGASGKPWTSADGNKVVYESTASNLAGTSDGNGAVPDVYAYDKTTGATTLLSTTSSGGAANAASTGPQVACNGSFVVFESRAPLLGAGASAGVRNIYALTFGGGGKRLISRGTGGANADGDSGNARISDDGRFVVFDSIATNLVAGDSNGRSDVFVYDSVGNSMRRISQSAAGVQGNGDSRAPRMPCDASYVMFDSTATNLVAGDSNGVSDVYVADLGSGTVALASQTAGGGVGNGASTNGEVSPDGTAIGFDSSAGNLGGSGPGSVLSGQNPFAARNYSGTWYDPNQSGHGLFLDQLPDGRLVAWWFSFDPTGAQAWFGGVGVINGTTAVINMVRTQGARFIPNFNSAQAVNTPIGTLSFSFSACDRGRVDFALDSTFGTGFMNLTRLTAPIGVACTATPATMAAGFKSLGIAQGWRADFSPLVGPVILKASEPTVGPIAGLTGVWYDPAQAGQGLFLENLGNGSVLGWWFTFGPNGGQAWFGGLGTILDGNRARIEFTRTSGGRWIPNFDPAAVANPAIGPVTLTLSSCGQGRADFQFAQGFGSGTLPLQPLVRAVGTACDD